MSQKNVADPEEITGQSALPSAYIEPPRKRMQAISNVHPVSRIKKIIQLDDDIVQCSNNATFVIARATVCHVLLLLRFLRAS